MRPEAGKTSMRVPPRDLLARADAGRGRDVVEPAVGARADDDLLDRGPDTASIGFTLSTVCGQAICGASVAASISIVRS